MSIATLRIAAGGGIDNSITFFVVPKDRTDEEIMVAVANDLRKDFKSTPALESFDFNPSVRVSSRTSTEAGNDIVEVTISAVITFNATFHLGDTVDVARSLEPVQGEDN